MKLLIWDFDGTLGQRKGAWSGALADVLESEGISIEPDCMRPFRQSGFPWHMPEQIRPADESAESWWKRLEPVFAGAFEKGCGISQKDATRLATKVRDYYVAHSKWTLYDDSIAVISELSRRGWRHMLLSNHVPELAMLLDGLGIAPLFDLVFNSAITGVEKPHPAAFLNVLSGLPSERTVWMIGDNMTADVLGAEAQGIPAILVRRSHPHAKRQCRELSELYAILESGR